MKKLLLLATTLILAVTLVGCKKRYNPIINIEDFDKDWTFDSSIDTHITFAHTMGKTEDPSLGQQALLDAQVTEFVKEMKTEFGWNVRVTHSQYGGYDELQDKLSKELSTGNEPSMAYAYPDHVASYIASDKVLPLDNLINNKDSKVGLSKADYADYVESFLQEGREYDLNGTTLSVPFSKSTEVMFYNKTFFETHGLQVPQTWDEVRTVSEKIKEIQGPTWSGTPFGYDSDDNLFIVRSAQLGLPYTQLNPETLKGEVVFNTDGNKKMVESLVGLVEDGLMTTKGLLSGAYTSDAFKKQELMMTVGSTGGTQHNVPDGNLFEVGVARMPQETANKKDQKTILQGPSIVLFRKGLRPAGTEDADGNIAWTKPQPTQAQINEMVGAWMFYKYITRPEETIRQATGTGYLPVRISAYDTDTYKDYIKNPVNKKDQAKADVLGLAKELMEEDAFFVSPAFPTSSKARKAVGILLIDSFNKKGTLDNLFRVAIASAQ